MKIAPTSGIIFCSLLLCLFLENSAYQKYPIPKPFNIAPQDLLKYAKNFTFIEEIPDDQISYSFFLKRNKNETGFFVNYYPYRKLSTYVDDVNAPWLIIFHGWYHWSQTYWIKDLARNYSKLYDDKVNIMTVDWEKYSINPKYQESAEATRAVAKKTAEWYIKYIDDVQIFKKFYLVGHGLGAHVAGFFGKYIQEMEKITIKRITGLDPASYFFEIPFPRAPKMRLDRTDATFVDILHTNKGLEGISVPYGHVDCYINNGSPFQPGCELNATNVQQAMWCSHQKANEYFIGSVQDPKSLEGTTCPWESFGCRYGKKIKCGLSAPPKARGVYNVRKSSPKLNANFHFNVNANVNAKANVKANANVNAKANVKANANVNAKANVKANAKNNNETLTKIK